MYELLKNAGIDIIDFNNAFKLMGVGMLGIFIVMIVISAIVFISTKISLGKKQK